VRRQALQDQLQATIVRHGVRLAARLLLPAVPDAAAVMFVHGLGSGKDSPRNIVIAERLRDAGIASLLFDLSGHGDATTDPRADEQAAWTDDVAAAFAWLRARPEVDGGRIGIAGSSLGGVIALDALRAGSVSPRALVLRAPPLAGHELAAVDVPTLVIVGSRDPLSSVIGVLARSPHVRLVSVPGASHLFEEPGTLERALEDTVGFFRETLAADAAAREDAS